MIRVALAYAAVLAAAGLASAQTAPKRTASVDAAVVDAYIKGMWKKVPEGWQARIEQDETQRVCSQYRNAPPDSEFAKIVAREKANVVLPADGNVMGDWKEGEKVAQNGRGGQFSDPPGTVNGGNCYACHQMAKAELSFGTLGPSLLEYGKTRKFSVEEAKLAYARVFNSQSAQPCSMMPRFGYHKVLSEQQIRDVVAYLMSPDSPVNK
ncbi:MAG TPA: sulfur oxidation c-type cytochrome SoxX [Hyphomicrobiaceae bacterium]|jgi:sulfur-oxidizing protein SoxX|nr:sulfur oxidation c-type cytochrome SoxX [Hyphomicrobiaceae bacterium]